MKPFVLIIGLLVGSGAGKAGANTSFRGEAAVNMNMFRTGLLTFRAQNGRYPTQSEGLNVLVQNPDPAEFPNWKQLFKQLPLDPWGNPYQYVSPLPGTDAGCGIYSCGPDDISRSGGNDPDDQNTWDPKRPWKGEMRRREFLSNVTPAAIAGGILFIIFAAFLIQNRR